MKLSAILLAVLIILISISSSSGQGRQYELPGNKNQPKNKLFKVPYSPPDHRLITVSGQLIPWSDYLGIKDSYKTISPDRMIWEVLTRISHNERKTGTYKSLKCNTNKAFSGLIACLQQKQSVSRKTTPLEN